MTLQRIHPSAALAAMALAIVAGPVLAGPLRARPLLAGSALAEPPAPGAATATAPPVLRVQSVDATGRVSVPRPTDPMAPPFATGQGAGAYGPYPPYAPFGPYGPAPQSQAQAPPCPDTGSTAVVERGRPRGSRAGPLVAMPSNDCADLPGRATVQPYIGVDVQVTPPGFGGDAGTGNGSGSGAHRPVFPVQPIVPHRPGGWAPR